MKVIEKYVWWVSILTLLVVLLVSIYYLGYFGISSRAIASVMEKLLAATIPNVIFGFWLFWAAKQEARPRAPWTLFGLSYGIVGVAVFYIILIYFQNRAIRATLHAQSKNT